MRSLSVALVVTSLRQLVGACLIGGCRAADSADGARLVGAHVCDPDGRTSNSSATTTSPSTPRRPP